MRIGIMLRTLDESGGVAVYSKNILDELLELDRHNDYVLFYRNKRHLGRLPARPSVTEVVLEAGSKAIWDQVFVPLACRTHDIDVLFHPKFTAPLLAPCPVVMTVHGADWLVPEQAQYYSWLDVRYVRMMMPRYFRKCSKVISVSQLTTQNFYELLDLPADKIRTIYFAPARHFAPVTDPVALRQVREKYRLPDRFILTLTKPLGDRRKNLPEILKAYARYHHSDPDPHSLVIGGKDCHLFRSAYRIPDSDYGADIYFPGWIEQGDLPAVYSCASLFLYPSNLEAFPIPVTEAMKCGTPIVTSDVNGLAEIGGDAAVLVNPHDSAEIARGISQVLNDVALQNRLRAKGFARSRRFSWDSCTRETLAVIEEAARVQEVTHVD